jgi:hypothetical protein
MQESSLDIVTRTPINQTNAKLWSVDQYNRGVVNNKAPNCVTVTKSKYIRYGFHFLIIFSINNVVINKYIHVTCLPPSPGKGMIRLLSSLEEDAGHNS